MKDNHLKDIKTPKWTCPNCEAVSFDSQRAMIQHALPCKRNKDKLK